MPSLETEKILSYGVIVEATSANKVIDDYVNDPIGFIKRERSTEEAAFLTPVVKLSVERVLEVGGFVDPLAYEVGMFISKAAIRFQREENREQPVRISIPEFGALKVTKEVPLSRKRVRWDLDPEVIFTSQQREFRQVFDKRFSNQGLTLETVDSVFQGIQDFNFMVHISCKHREAA